MSICAYCKLRMNSPAPTSATSESAIWATTNAFRTRPLRRPPPIVPASSLSVETSSGFDACNAGARPNTTPVIRETASVKTNTRQSIVRLSQTGRPRSGTNETSVPAVHNAKSRPHAPPSSASIKLSVNNCRTKRRRLAPSASRIPISRRRAVARPSRRLATLAQAIRSTTPATAIKIAKTGSRNTCAPFGSCANV